MSPCCVIELLLLFVCVFTVSVLMTFLQSVEQSMKHLDMISPYETHKIGVIYIKPGQVWSGLLSRHFDIPVI